MNNQKIKVEETPDGGAEIVAPAGFMDYLGSEYGGVMGLLMDRVDGPVCRKAILENGGDPARVAEVLLRTEYANWHGQQTI